MTFSIVVPTYGRPRQLEECLRSLARLDHPEGEFEILVVNDGAPGWSTDIAEPFRTRMRLTLLTQPHAGPAMARNTGATKARGRFLVFTDDDCTPTPTWLSALEVRLAAAPDGLVGGHTINALPENPYSTASQMLIDYLYAYYNNAAADRATFFASNNMAVPAEGFARLGGFDTSFPLPAGEDREFCDRWLRSRRPMLYAPEAVVYHAHPLSLGGFWRQHMRYGRGAFYFHRARARHRAEAVRLEPLRFYRDLLRCPFPARSSRHAFQLAALLAMSQVANAAGFFREAVASRAPANG